MVRRPASDPPHMTGGFAVKMRSILLTVLFASACADGNDPDASHDVFDLDGFGLTADEYRSDRIIVGFTSHELPTVIEHRGHQFELIRKVRNLRAGIYSVQSDLDAREAVEIVRSSTATSWVELDHRVGLAASGSEYDPFRPLQWNLDKVDAEGAWDASTGSGVTVAVIDTGVTSGPNDGIHGLLPGYDFHNDDADATDDNGHGTHVAGTIAQSSLNGIGVAGLAYEANILPVKVLGADGSGWSSDVIEGMLWAAEQGAEVINLSLASRSSSALEAEAVLAIHSMGVTIVAASGNDGDIQASYPAGYEGVLAVGATDNLDHITPYSNGGVDLVAPGGDLSQDADNDGIPDGIVQETHVDGAWDYYLFQGTSMASPHVAAAAALVRATGATTAETEEALLATATTLGNDSFAGAGRLDAAAAVQYTTSVEPDTTPPVATTVQAIQQHDGSWMISFSSDEELTGGRVCRVDGSSCAGATGDGFDYTVQIRGQLGSAYRIVMRDLAGNMGWAGPYTLAL